jgi:anthranilate phosphoribosyltransferase
VTDRSTPPTLDDLGGWRTVLSRLTARENLTSEEAGIALAHVLEGHATPAQVAGFLVALRMKGETTEEIVGMVDAMLEEAEPLLIPAESIDIVGTGGAVRRRQAALNVSTMACFVAAGAGATVCKHGNRRASSTSGSFDLLEALGVTIELDGVGVARCIEETGIGFCFARAFHPAMRHAGPVRAELGIPTVFNILGPLSHPGRVDRQVIGVADPSLADRVIGVLAARGAPRAMVVHGDDGLDELTITTTSTVHELRLGEVEQRVIDPTDYGIDLVSPDALPGGDPAENARLAHEVFQGAPGAVRDIVTLNAAAGLVVSGIVDELGDGIDAARASIDHGRAKAVLDQLVNVSAAAADAD